jgi:hypothetical protein
MTHVFPFSDNGSFVICYLDDKLVFSNSETEHLRHLEKVFARLREMKLFIKRSKCSFGCNEINFVGQLVGHGQRRIDPGKADLIRQYPIPKNCTDVRSFYGLLNYCRDFLPGLSTISGPLTDLTKKYAPFIWTNTHQQAFDRIKELVANAIEVAIPDPELSYVMQSDASDVGLGATLLQPDPLGNLRPVVIASRKLNIHSVIILHMKKNCLLSSGVLWNLDIMWKVCR